MDYVLIGRFGQPFRRIWRNNVGINHDSGFCRRGENIRIKRFVGFFVVRRPALYNIKSPAIFRFGGSIKKKFFVNLGGSLRRRRNFSNIPKNRAGKKRKKNGQRQKHPARRANDLAQKSDREKKEITFFVFWHRFSIKFFPEPVPLLPYFRKRPAFPKKLPHFQFQSDRDCFQFSQSAAKSPARYR